MPAVKGHHYEEKARLDTSNGTSEYDYIISHEQQPASVLIQKRLMSMKELLILLSMSFSYALCFNTLSNILIPKTVARLTDGTQSLWVGTLMTLGAICQTSTPLIGAYSDRIGSRAIFLMYGSGVTVLGLFLFVLAEVTELLIVLCIAQVASAMGLSIVYSMITALLNDYVLEEQTGKGSGAMALLALTGSGVGYAMLALDVPVTYCLCSYVLATLFCLVTTMSFIPNVEPLRQSQTPIRVCDVVTAAFTMPSFRVFPDFVFACIGRSLFNFGLAAQVYLVFFVRDVFGSSVPVRITSALSIAALIGGLVGAIPSGIFSDRIGRKPVIYAAVFICASSLMLLLMVRDMTLLYAVGFLHGVGSAAYLSVDHALGIATLPRKCGVPVDAAKDLGLFATSATIGTLIGQVVYGAVLHAFVTHTEAGIVRYSHLGFLVVYSISCLAFVASGVIGALIRVK
ncbi:Major facilitator superfamily [Trypanosoma melophagium]|uniref:Major facilitator superfamily n=1 Tax=Trypanosoma melophagium TaxID=715481 RepID=UPI003519F4A3|nr:Major facilitator superfamily [Trypanosoma melophagium]